MGTSGEASSFCGRAEMTGRFTSVQAECWTTKEVIFKQNILEP